MSQPLVSCIMLTYGRRRKNVDGTQLIDEAVESFLRQNYRNKELILLNDAPQQKIIYNHPLVRVINHPHRFKTLGAKRNYAIEQSQGDLIACWDDDDICLPRRLPDSFNALLEQGADYVSAKHHFSSSRNKHYRLVRSGSYGLWGTYLTFREAFKKRPYRDMNSGEDQHFFADIKRAGLKIGYYAEDPKQASYIYRWGFLARHISSLNDETGYDQLGREPLPACEIHLRPRWCEPYPAAVRKAFKK